MKKIRTTKHLNNIELYPQYKILSLINKETKIKGIFDVNSTRLYPLQYIANMDKYEFLSKINYNITLYNLYVIDKDFLNAKHKIKELCTLFLAVKNNNVYKFIKSIYFINVAKICKNEHYYDALEEKAIIDFINYLNNYTH